MLQYKGVVFASVAAEIHSLCFKEAWSEEEFKKLLSLPTSRLWIDENSLLLCSEVADEMEILTICVIPEKRRCHLAKRLLNELFSYATKHKIKCIFLEVAKDNIPAQNLYLGMGFIQTGQRTGYYKRKNGTVDALCFTKKI